MKRQYKNSGRAKIYRQKAHHIFVLLLCALLLAFTGCGGRTPNTGEKPFVLGRYDVGTEGLATVVAELGLYEPLPEALRVERFEAALDSKGRMTAFELVLHGYGEGLAYTGSYTFTYNKADGLQTAREAADSPPEYNPNTDPAHLDAQLRRIDLAQQLALLGYAQPTLLFEGITRQSAGAPVVDGTGGGALPLLTLAEAQNGVGGVSNGASGLYFVLHDATGGYTTRMYLRMEAADPATLNAGRDSQPEFGYTYYGGVLYLGRDYGETWIEVPLDADAFEETFAFYRNGGVIPEDSYSITAQPGALALIYGGASPSLLLSGDDGVRWRSVTLAAYTGWDEGFPLAVTKRIVHFFDGDNGYVGLGSDWSMGTGEFKLMMATTDGGESWQTHYLPLGGTSEVLSGLAFADMQAGVASMKHQYTQEQPVSLFYTLDGGASWEALDIPDGVLPEGYEYIHKVDSLAREGGGYRLVLGQGNDKVALLADTLDGVWRYESHWRI